MSESAKIYGRVHYIDPTNLKFYNQSGSGPVEVVPSNELVFNQPEDLCIAVDLEVMIPNRNACGHAKENGEYTTYTYSSSDGTISFIGGTNGVLSTSYTDINPLIPGEGNQECLGIESIDISYQSWMYPEVTIKFVDVRGASVMLPEDYKLTTSETKGSIYRAFFSWPPPLFKLKVKGFYGKGATYYLSYYDVSINLDASSGNFVITVKFVGSMYRIYTDMPMSYVCAAPYLTDGAEYWKSKIDDGTFYFTEIGADGQAVKTIPMMTIPELFTKFKEISINQKHIDMQNDRDGIASATETRLSNLYSLRDVPTKDWLVYKDHAFVVSTESAYNEKMGEAIDNYVEKVINYDSTYGTSFAVTFNQLKQYGKASGHCENIHKIEYTKDSNGAITVTSGKNLQESYGIKTSGEDKVYDYVMNEIAKTPQDPVHYLYIIPKVDETGISEFLKKIEGEQKNVVDSKNEKEREFKELERQYLKDVLGFTPSIRNIYNLVFAHMDTFISSFYKQTDNILNKKDERKASNTLNGLDNDLADDGVIPPYPGIYKKVTENGETRNTMQWLGDLPGGNEYDETMFVYDLLQATKTYAESMPSGSTSGSSVDKGTNEDSPRTDVGKFLPMTPYDFVNKDKMSNPYSWLVKAVEKYDESGLEDAIFGTFFLRAMYYMSSTKKSKIRREAKTFGKLEAINLSKALGKEYGNPKFLNVIKEYGDGKGNRKDANTVLEKMRSSSQAWDFSGKRIVDEKGDYALHAASQKEFPIGESSFLNIKNAYAGGENSLANNGRFINVKNDLSQKQTFFVFKSAKDYIKGVYDSVVEDVNANYSSVIGGESGLKTYEDNFDSVIDVEDGKYIKGTIFTVDGDKDVKAVDVSSVVNKTYDERKEYYVKFPTRVIKGNKDDINLFSTDIYRAQYNICAKAYLFLLSIPLSCRANVGDDAYQNCGIVDTNESGTVLKSRLLREGALYWSLKHINDIVFSGETFSCRKPNVADGRLTNETMMTMDGKTCLLNIGNPKKYEEFRIIRTSRVEVLEKMFNEWANGEFAKIEKDLSSSKYYKSTEEYEYDQYGNKKGKKEGGPNYKGGFDSSNLSKDKTTQEWQKSNDIQKFLLSLYLDVSTTIDYYGNSSIISFRADEYSGIDENTKKQCVLGFIEGLTSIYKDVAEKSTNEVYEEVQRAREADPFNNKDLRLSTYKMLKELYDRWLCAPYKGQNTWKLGENGSDFESFVYLDAYYHEIGDSILVNITKTYQWFENCLPTMSVNSIEGIMGYVNKSVYDFLTAVAQDVGGMLLAFPQLIGGRSVEHLSNMFKAMPYNSDWDEDTSTFLFMYNYEPSKFLGQGDYKNDGFDITEQVEFLSDNGMEVPAFGVSYGKQNQSFFKNITLSTEGAGMTEAAMQATLNLTARASNGQRDTYAFGQDIYRVRASYAYECSFDMMGCIQVMPMMYFQLNNVPFWHGAYIIYNVTHSITAGDMTTHVKGVRISKNSLPVVDGAIADQKTGGYNQEGPGGGQEGSCQSPAGTSSMMGSSSPLDVSGNRSINIKDEIDFTESNITEYKPLICLTPAHGPNTEKSAEWTWSSKLIDDYIIPKLKKLKFYDGTSYETNVQRCNKGGSHTGGGYSMIETTNLIKKFGSKCVMSLVPHWNGDRAQRFEVFPGYEDPNNGCENVMREDSSLLGDIILEEAQKLIQKYNSGELKKAPRGFCDKGTFKKLLSCYKHKKDGPKELNTMGDGAPKVNCACVLTENWFTNYRSDGGKFWIGNKDDLNDPAKVEKMNALDGEGRYILLEGWLFDKEGMDAISDMHVNAIKRYIDGLSSRVPFTEPTKKEPYKVVTTLTAEEKKKRDQEEKQKASKDGKGKIKGIFNSLFH